MLVVDDALLLRVLGGVAVSSVMAELERGELYTTGVWYHRLSRAAHDDRSVGTLSRELATFDQDVQHYILESLDQLPDRIGLIGWRRLVPVMSVLNVGRNLNLLAAEALAVGLVVGADIGVTTDAPLVREGAATLDLGYRVIRV